MKIQSDFNFLLWFGRYTQLKWTPIWPNFGYILVWFANLEPPDFLNNLKKVVVWYLLHCIKVSSSYHLQNTFNYSKNNRKTAIFWQFFRPVSGYWTIASGRWSGRSWKYYINLLLKIPLATMYNTWWFMPVERSLIDTDKQTNKQTE